MPRVDVQKEKQLFKEKLEKGYFATERSKNCEVNYPLEKEQRDTEAVKEFTQTETFQFIKNMR